MCSLGLCPNYLLTLSCTLHVVLPAVADGPITLHYNKYVDGSKIGTPASMEVDMVIGADGANSRVAKEIDAGEYDYAIAFQERIRIPGEHLGPWFGCCGGFAAARLGPTIVLHSQQGYQETVVGQGQGRGCAAT